MQQFLVDGNYRNTHPAVQYHSIHLLEGDVGDSSILLGSDLVGSRRHTERYHPHHKNTAEGFADGKMDMVDSMAGTDNIAGLQGVASVESQGCLGQPTSTDTDSADDQPQQNYYLTMALHRQIYVALSLHIHGRVHPVALRTPRLID